MQSILEQLDNELKTNYDEFVKAFSAYTAFAEDHNIKVETANETGYKIDMKDLNKLVLDVQVSFHKCHGTLAYIAEKSKFANQAIFDFHAFIETLKKQGANQINKDQIESFSDDTYGIL